MDMHTLNISLQALLAITLILSVISGGITWLAGQVAGSKFDKFKAELKLELMENYATKQDLRLVGGEIKIIMAAIDILKEGLLRDDATQ